MAQPQTSLAPNNDLNSLLGQAGGPVGQLLQQRQKVTDQAVAGSQKTQGQLQGITDQMGAMPTPQQPQLQPINTKPPEYHQLEPIQAFQNWGVVLAMFGSLFTRAPITSAFKSGAAAMKAFHENDLQTFEIQRQNWKDQIDEALQQNKQELEKYDTALKSSEFDMSKLTAQFQGIAAANKDQVMLSTLQAGNIDQAINIIQHREDMQQRLKSLSFGQDLRNDAMKMRQEALDEAKRHHLAQEGLAGGKVTSANDLTGLMAQGDAINKIITDHQGTFDSLTGAMGAAKRGIQRFTGQLGVNLFPEATDLEGKISAFQTQLTRPFLKAHYFTEPTIARIEELASGMNFEDDPQTTIQNYKTILGILQDQQKSLAASGASPSDAGSADDLSSMSDDQLLQLYQQGQ